MKKIAIFLCVASTLLAVSQKWAYNQAFDSLEQHVQVTHQNLDKLGKELKSLELLIRGK